MKLKQRPVTLQTEKAWVHHTHVTGWTNLAVVFLVTATAALTIGLTRLLMQPTW
ncbi:MAG TPA: hypothetical protein VK550_16205 [Polyangiaceae bacterium]|nr:hypothetical protein [Polyangiaceae bacterium]